MLRARVAGVHARRLHHGTRRTIVAHKDEMWLQAGAGIVEASDPDKEYEESVNKARAGLVAVKAGQQG